jgi:uncharacterized Fe-S center protein
VTFKDIVPLKVHFGEKGNTTYIKPENYNGIIDLLKEKKINSSFIETNVLYGGERNQKNTHIKLAKEHGFTKLPIIIADGECGEDYENIKISQKNFEYAMLGKEFSNYSQYIVLSHFKGHQLAGFGGAMKQLSMGFASRGGKLAMHMGVKPKIKQNKCVKCKLCMSKCSENAIIINEKQSIIDYNKCVGCGACVAICPHNAITIFSLKGVLNAFSGIVKGDFLEKLAEYALAAHKKNNIYINFLMNITKGCDCEGHSMKPVVDDIGILISTDPVAIDKACYDLVKEKGKNFRGEKIFKYAQKIGLGSIDYNLIEF